jgi:hypothetical protein
MSSPLGNNFMSLKSEVFEKFLKQVLDELSVPDLGGWQCQYRRNEGRTLWTGRRSRKKETRESERSKTEASREFTLVLFGFRGVFQFLRYVTSHTTRSFCL